MTIYTINIKIRLLTFLAFCGFCSFNVAAKTDNPGPYTVGIIQIVDHPALNQTRKGIEDMLREALESRVTITVKMAQGNPVNALGAAQKFKSEQVDIIITLGTSASIAAASAVKGSNIPVVFSSVTDPVQSKLVQTLNAPGGQVTGVSNATPIKPQLEFFKELVPNLKRLGMIMNPGEPNSVVLVDQTTEAAMDLDVSVQSVGVTKTHEVALAVRKLITSGVDAIFINNDNTALAAFDVITQIASEENIPVFVSDTDYVNTRKSSEANNKKPIGALAALGPNQYKIGQQTGEMALLILDGKDPATFAVQFPSDLIKVIDTVMMKKLGLLSVKNTVAN